MKMKKVIVTGTPTFLYRYQYLFKALTPYFEGLEFLPCGDRIYKSKISNTIAEFTYKLLYKFSLKRADQLFQKNHRLFIAKSRQAEEKIRQLEYTPDLVIQVFGMFSPFWEKFDIPYVIYLDYTMALAVKNWSPWAPFINSKQREAWLECERQTYQRAYHLFPMSSAVKSSLIKDYGVEPQKITVVGSAGNFLEPYEGEKPFGSQQILFNGSDFERKGGALVVEAFKKVKQTIPGAKLVIIGKKINHREPGLNNPGKIKSRSELHDLFLHSDLVVAPSYCEPFQEFLLEAMNYGLPCIVSDKDGMPEIIDSEVNGLIINSLTPDALADSIVNLLSNPTKLEAMSQAARQKVKSQFNWNSIAENITAVLP